MSTLFRKRLRQKIPIRITRSLHCMTRNQRKAGNIFRPDGNIFLLRTRKSLHLSDTFAIVQHLNIFFRLFCSWEYMTFPAACCGPHDNDYGRSTVPLLRHSIYLFQCALFMVESEMARCSGQSRLPATRHRRRVLPGRLSKCRVVAMTAAAFVIYQRPSDGRRRLFALLAGPSIACP